MMKIKLLKSTLSKLFLFLMVIGCNSSPETPLMNAQKNESISDEKSVIYVQPQDTINNKKEYGRKATEEAVDLKSVKLSVKELISLLDYCQSNNESAIITKIRLLKFRKKANGVFISESNVAPNEPENWLHFTFCGGGMATVSLSTTNKKLWKEMIGEISKKTKKSSFEDGTSDITYRYIGKNYTFETYEPKDGLNLALNNLFQIYAFKSE